MSHQMTDAQSLHLMESNVLFHLNIFIASLLANDSISCSDVIEEAVTFLTWPLKSSND